jgi:pSer/pThr/pTyr-binding forkhead associated (FHA) protein
MSTPIQASFHVNKGIDGISMIPIDASSFIAGNSDAVDIKLENRFVSRRHFQVRFESDVFYISDLGSTNGTYLNGSKLNPNEERILRDGDRVGLGVDEVLLVFSGPARTVRIDTAVIAKAGQADDDDLVVDASSRDVWVRGGKLPSLPRKEFDIIECLFQNRGQAVSRDEIAAAGWPERPDDVPNSDIDQYIRRLRRKIEEDPSKPTIIVTRVGYGYTIP